MEGTPPVLVGEQGWRIPTDPSSPAAGTITGPYRVGEYTMDPDRFRRRIGGSVDPAASDPNATRLEGRRTYHCPRKSCSATYPYNDSTLLRAYREAVRTGRREILAGVDI
jgi:hypothetical protein